MLTNSPVPQTEDDPQRVSWKNLVNSKILGTPGFPVTPAQSPDHI